MVGGLVVCQSDLVAPHRPRPEITRAEPISGRGMGPGLAWPTARTRRTTATGQGAAPGH